MPVFRHQAWRDVPLEMKARRARRYRASYSPFAVTKGLTGACFNLMRCIANLTRGISTALNTKPTDVAGRLRLLQAKNALTIQAMADRCGLPKCSLKNDMNLKNPQRPGLDALVA